MRSLAHALALVVFLLPLHVHIHDLADRMSLIPVAKIKPDQRCEYKAPLGAALATTLPGWVPAPHQSILDFDSKQNLLRWPVLALGLIRSPPRA